LRLEACRSQEKEKQKVVTVCLFSFKDQDGEFYSPARKLIVYFEFPDECRDASALI